jgi:hypothetical protein
VQTLILRGVFLCRRADVDYFFQGNAAEFAAERVPTDAPMSGDRAHKRRLPGYVKDHVVPLACGVSWRSSGQWDRRRHRPDRRRKTLGEERAGRDNLEILAQAKEILVRDICVTS